MGDFLNYKTTTSMKVYLYSPILAKVSRQKYWFRSFSKKKTFESETIVCG
jgi:hypothetical protein